MKGKIASIIFFSIVTIIAFVSILSNISDVRTVSAALNTTSCSTGTTTPVVIGNQATSTILAKRADRAWALIQQPQNATNTVAVAFSGFMSADMAEGVQLQSSSSTTGISYLKFGLSTELPDTGIISGLTSTGSTTVLVTECTYN
jgi:hypothetical protein